MDFLRPPSPLSLEGSVAVNWKRWEQAFQNYLTAVGADKFSRTRQIAILLSCVGQEAVEIYNTFVFEDTTEPRDIAEILEKFRDYYIPRTNVIFERYLFWSCLWKQEDSVDSFVTSLRAKAKNCEFGSVTNEMIRDKIVFSAPDQMKERLLKQSDLTLEKALELCRVAEVTTAWVQTMACSGKQQQELCETHQDPEEIPVQALGYKKPSFEKKQASVGHLTCGRCGTEHRLYKCPAFGKICHKCGKKNHFAKWCRLKAINESGRQEGHQVHNVDLHSLFIGVLSHDNVESRVVNQAPGWYADVTLKGFVVQFKLDTGAEANVLPLKILNALPGQKELVKSQVTLVAYGGAQIKPTGTIVLEACTKQGKAKLLFYVTDTSTLPLLGRVACETLNLVRRIDDIGPVSFTSCEQLVTAYSDVFDGLGEFEGSHHIHTDQTVPPVIHGCRKIPVAILDRLKEALTQMQATGVVSRVEGPTEWVNSLVVTEKKNGKLRICLDPRDLNKAVCRQHYTIPTVEEVLAKLAGMKFFTIVDEKDGYWQVKLDEDSARLCTFNTPWGRYCFNRLPFGLKSSSEVFQQKNEETFGHIKGVSMIADDMIIAGKTSEEHDQILQQVMETARAKNIKFNKEKVQFKIDAVKYMGHIVTAQGVKVDEEKTKAIREMPSPQDRQGVLRFLGSVQYLSKFIPQESEITAPLRALLKKNVMFQWMPEHQAAFERVKQQLCQAPVLQYFDVEKSVTVQADASKNGLGACLMQADRPVFYASRSLNQAEQNYAQIEKELLAVLYAMRKFHQYVFGKEVLVQTDHKPLEVIFKRPIGGAPPRLQRMLLQLQRYQLNVVYTPGKYMYLADTLSRATVDPPNNDEEQVEGERVIHELSKISMHPEGVASIREATVKDDQLQVVVTLITQGWPQYFRDVPLPAKPFWPVRDSLRYEEGILYEGEKVVIPFTQRQEMLAQLHDSHQGFQRTKARAKSLMYWPGMSKDIEAFIGNCSVCAYYAPRNQKEPLIPHDIPELPWEKVGMDIFEHKSRAFLLVVDYYSKYPEVLSIPDKTAQTVIARLKAIFARHGIPKIVISDNMPFASREFRQFAQEWGFEQCFSSPGYPQSNGMAERTIRSIKQLIKKAEDSNRDPYLALLEYRNTPVTGMLYSPAQMLMSRTLRTKLPVTKDVLCPEVPSGVEECLKRVQDKQKYYYDQTAKSLRPLQEGDPVWVEEKEGWSSATVVEKCKQPRTYCVMTQGGHKYRRNRRKLRHRGKGSCSHQEMNQEVHVNNQRGQSFSRLSKSVYNGRIDNSQNSSVSQIKERLPNYITSYGRKVFSPERYVSS